MGSCVADSVKDWSKTTSESTELTDSERYSIFAVADNGCLRRWIEVILKCRFAALVTLLNCYFVHFNGEYDTV